MKDSSQLCATYILSLAFLPFDRGTRPSDRGIYLPEGVNFLWWAGYKGLAGVVEFLYYPTGALSLL